MAIVHDNSASNGGNSISSLTISSFVVASGADKALLVGCSIRGGQTVTGITWNGSENFSLVVALGDSNSRTEIWKLVNPTSGTFNVVITLSGSATKFTAGVTSLTGVHQTTPTPTSATASGTNTNSSVSITTANNNSWLFDSLSTKVTGSAATADSPQTERWNSTAGGNRGSASTKPLATAGGTTMSWTHGGNDYGWHLGAVEVQEAAGVTTTMTAETGSFVLTGNDVIFTYQLAADLSSPTVAITEIKTPVDITEIKTTLAISEVKTGVIITE